MGAITSGAARVLLFDDFGLGEETRQVMQSSIYIV